MNQSKRWYWLLLISSIQLCGLLAMILYLFSWQSQSVNRALDQYCWNENLSVLARVKEAIGDEPNPNGKVDSDLGFDKLALSMATSSLSSRCFVGLFDRGQGNLIQELTPEHPISHTRLMSQSVFSIDDNSQLGLVGKLLKGDKRSLNGWQLLDGERIIISARYLPRQNAILVVAQSPPTTKAQISQLIHSAGSYTFTVTLVIGLIAISVTGMFINRINETVNGLNGDLEKVVSQSTRELIRTKNAVIFGLAKLAESRDNDTGDHLERIRIYVTILAKHLAKVHPEFDERLVHDLGLASSLHDIGKVGIPDSILLKPGRLSPEERGIMEIHTLIGGECLDAIQGRLGDNEFMSIARQIAYYHHERWDGTGYPHSLKGSEIPLVARIVAVADVYDALTSKRPYKRAMSHSESKAIIVAGTGKQFDPEIVEAFLNHEDEFEAVSLHQQGISDEQATSNFQRLCEAARAEASSEKRIEAIASK